LILLPQRRSPSSTVAAQRLGPVVESHDSGTQPLPIGVVKRASRQSTRLSHKLYRSDSVLEPDGPASVDRSVDGGGVAREGVGEVGGVVVLDASGPRGRPCGPMEILVVWRVNNACTRSVTTVIRRTLSSSSSPFASP
jgi:hypothetical protein